MSTNRQTAMLLTILILSWVSCVLCRTRQDGRDLEPSIFSETIQKAPQRDTTNTTITLNLREIDAGYPEWEEDLTFSFEQFGDENELNQAKRAMLGVIDMLQTTMAVMYPGNIEITQPWPVPATSSSLERYFFIDDLPKVAEVFKRLLAALDAPGFKKLLDCYHEELLTVKVVYGDYWGSEQVPLCQDEPDTSAYTTWEEDDEHGDGTFQVISLCRPFFENYKDFKEIPAGLRDTNTIDPGTEINTYDLPCYTSALTFLHELLHWAAMGSSTLGYVIADQIIYDPRFKAKTKAYRAFYAMKMLDGVTYNKGGWTELSNVDNYVFAVQEIYWGVRLQRSVWQDPQQSPGYYPVNGPPPPGGA